MKKNQEKPEVIRVKNTKNPPKEKIQKRKSSKRKIL